MRVKIDHHTSHCGYANNFHQVHRVAHGVRVCPKVACGEGCRGWLDRHLAWPDCSVLGDVDETVEVTTQLGPQLWPGIRARGVV
jgi:hypothetical protein